MTYQQSRFRRSALLCGAAMAVAIAATPALAQEQIATIDIPAQPMDLALKELARQSGANLLFSLETVKGLQAHAVQTSATPEAAARMLLAGTDLSVMKDSTGSLIVQRADAPQGGSAAGGADNGTVQALIVTAQKREENIQDVPIAMSAFTQEDLTKSQVTGGPDLMTQVPNMTFTKTNFSSYSIQIRGIGTQAISATTDAAVAVAFNNTPFIRNRFFEQEFYDMERVEVLRGPQGTLYGRNATAGVVNLISAKPSFHYEAKLSADVGNYNSSRFEGMVNLPLVEDKVALRIAGAWTKRDGYDTNQITGKQIDGRDLWSTRTSLRIDPTDHIGVNLIWEHFQENDDRLRSGKQLCNQDNRDSVGGLLVAAPGKLADPLNAATYSNIYSQGCLPASLYSPDSYQAPNGYALPYFLPLSVLGLPVTPGFEPYASQVQSPNLRVIESTVDPVYRAKSDLMELQWHADIGHALTLTSETAYDSDSIFSSEDYNRFDTASGAFQPSATGGSNANGGYRTDYVLPGPNGGVFCDPQVGCADRVVAVDLSRADSSQFSQEFRLSSDYQGPFNFSLGANFLRYDTMEKYYVFINTLTMLSAKGGAFISEPLPPWQPGVSDNHECFPQGLVAPDPNTFQTLKGCPYIDPNPIASVNDLGHNYFLSKNPYKLISYAVFGEGYYNFTDNLKLTAGLRWTVDKKEAPRIPSMLIAGDSVGLSVLTVQEQEWREPTGRLALDWKPQLPFTDQTLLYASYAHGYKAGGSNPPPSGITAYGADVGAVKLQDSIAAPKTFNPEFVNAFEVGTKNTLLDGKLTLNADAFYYDYKGYQISQIVDRSAINYNFDSKVWGLELEADWRPIENLRLGFKGGYEHTRIADGMKAIDIMDRTAGHSDWIVVRPFPTYPSNCILPAAVFNNGFSPNTHLIYSDFANGYPGPCEYAYAFGLDPVTQLPYVPDPTLTRAHRGSLFDPATELLATADLTQRFLNYAGFDPATAPNHGEGFFKELGGHELPNAPHFTATVTADYTIPLPSDWLMTLHGDFYYQSEAWTRVFNTPGYDKLKAYNNVNFAAIFTNEDAGWKVMAYVKNVFDKDNITGAFLNSDDSGLTTNVFLNEPRLYGIRVTKDWNGGPWWTGVNPNHTGPYPLTVELSGEVQRQDALYSSILPPIASTDAAAPQHRGLDWGDGREVRITYQPDAANWSVMAAVRYGRANSSVPLVHRERPAGPARCEVLPNGKYGVLCDPSSPYYYHGILKTGTNWADASAQEREKHVIADFQVGADVGLGLLRESRVSAGIRYANIESTTRTMMRGINWDLQDGWIKYPSTRNEYEADLTADRKFKGAGPTLTWAAGQALLGNEEAGHVDLDWSITGGVLFGKQRTKATGSYATASPSVNYLAAYRIPLVTPTPQPLGVAPRDKSATVPVLDLSLGLSYEIQRIKVGAGYHWERYYNALDAGYAERKSYDRTFDGPYFKIAVGFGG
jgi:outer membrane receptor protein involved in Fe transport